MKNSNKKKIVAALDIGSSKICCAVANIKDEHSLEILSFAERKSFGIRSGEIESIRDCEDAVTNVIHDAEKFAKIKIDSIVTNISTKSIKGLTIEKEIAITNQFVKDKDIENVFALAKTEYENENVQLLHISPIQYYLDDKRFDKAPIDEQGDILKIHIHLVTIFYKDIIKLHKLLDECNIDTLNSSVILSPYASALAVLNENEKKEGVICIDFGSETTSIVFFHNEALMYTSVLPVGGKLISKDIVEVFQTPFLQADKLKLSYNSMIKSNLDTNAAINLPIEGEISINTENEKIPLGMLKKVIDTRVEELIDLVFQNYKESGIDSDFIKNVVITGGSSKLISLSSSLRRKFKKKTRIGYPDKKIVSNASISKPEFSVVIGLLLTEVNQWDHLNKLDKINNPYKLTKRKFSLSNILEIFKSHI